MCTQRIANAETTEIPDDPSALGQEVCMTKEEKG